MKRSAAVAGVLAVIAATSALSYYLGQRPRDSLAKSQEKVTAWTCSMHPQVNLPEPGKCPICFMDLIPLDNAYSGRPRELIMSRQAAALAQIMTAPVERRFVTNTIHMVGKVEYDETKVSYITAWVAGRLDRLFIDSTGVTVGKGEHLVKMYSPDLVVAQRELILAHANYRKYGRQRGDQLLLSTLKSTEEKLRLLGLKQEQIDQIKQRGVPMDHVTIHAPSGGVVVHKDAKQGAYVKTGTRIYTIADLSEVWAYLDAYESDLKWLRDGQELEFTTETYPGEIFPGRVTLIEPVLNEKTRTVKVRVSVPNQHGRLKPGMFVRARVKSRVAEDGRVIDDALAGKWISPHHPEIVRDGPGKCPKCGVDLVPAEERGFVKAQSAGRPPLVIPASAPLITGKRAVVYVKVDPLRFEDWHVMNWRGLASKLRRTAKEEKPSPVGRVWQLLGEDLQRDIAKLAQRPILGPGLKRRILSAFNRILEDRAFYRPQDWKGIKLTEEVRGINAVSTRRFTPEESRLANRRLLETAFEDDINIATNEPTFLGREVMLGDRAGDYYVVRHGLAEVDHVVTQGNFKIDSALQIAAKQSMMSPGSDNHEGHQPGQDNHEGHQGHEDSGRPTSDIEVTSGFRVQLNSAYQAYLAAGEALARDDLAAAKQPLERLIASIKGVSARPLHVEARDRWKELGDQVVFAAYEAVEARNRAEARESFHQLSAAMLPFTRTFGHALDSPLYEFHCPLAFEKKGAKWLQTAAAARNPYFGPENRACGAATRTFHSLAPLNVPASFRHQLGRLYDAYLELQTQLAADKPAESAAAAVAMRQALSRIDPASLDPRASRAWTRARRTMTAALKGDVAKGEIAALRTRFKSLSGTMLTVADRFGHPQSRPLFKVYCSMAFHNKGAPWLQADAKVDNPYFGAAMRRCGEFKRMFEAAGEEKRP